MKYLSTRSASESLSFSQVVLAGLARDGGLFLPENYPDCRAHFQQWQCLDYQTLALEIMHLYVGDDIAKDDLQQIIDKSYATFTVPTITPSSPFSGGEILELFHGPTFAFKDIALQFLGNLFEHLIAVTAQPLNIVGATSGDTGSAAIYGVRGKKGINIFMLHPEGKVSPVQEMQMTTVLDDNVFNLAIDGTFDDCQHIVKNLFNDLAFRDSHHLAAVNSINWARILAQTVYYFYAGLKFKRLNPHLPLIFSVPTGNFGDVFAGYVAQKMGLPVDKFIIATNENDIISRVINSGEYQLEPVAETYSPAMDIQISSNFERILFDLCHRNPDKVCCYMDSLKKHGCFTLSTEETKKLQTLFSAKKVSNEETLMTMEALNKENYVVDPHTAVGICAAQKSEYQSVICLSTAHPAKFPEVVSQAIGSFPVAPEALKNLHKKSRKCISMQNKAQLVASFISQHC